jgi:isopentenyl-diphosphate delta-isomerase
MKHLTAHRKDDHIDINLHEDVSFKQTSTGFEHYAFEHHALPEIDLQDVDTHTKLFGKHLRFPLIISSMTGGSSKAARINQILAEGAQAHGVGMGLGSMRAALERQETAWTYQVRRYAPDILLFANLGAVQLNYGYKPGDCQRLVEMVEADGLILHLNPLQEALQPEGDTRFAGVLRRIEAVCKALDVPVLAKEVGWGFSEKMARRLENVGVAGIDIAGAGGTSWSQVEMHRGKTRVQREVAASFREWGIPTAHSTQYVRRAVPNLSVIASGGLRDGIDIAKGIALGADAGGIAGLLLRSATESAERLDEQLTILHKQFQTTMFVVGARDVATLAKTPLQYRNPHP